MRTQWHREEDPRAPLGHALVAEVRGAQWRAYELADGTWLLEGGARPQRFPSLASIRDHVEPRRNPGPRQRNPSGAAIGAFLGSVVAGTLGWGVLSLPVGYLGQIAGAAVGGGWGARADRRKRGAVGGAAGAAIAGPLGAAVGGWIGDRRPDADFIRNPAPSVDDVLAELDRREPGLGSELQGAVVDFATATDRALIHCFRQYPPAVDPSDLLANPRTWDAVARTVAGQPEGVWDGRWDHLYPEHGGRHWNRFVTCLSEQLAEPYERLESAVMRARGVLEPQQNPSRRLRMLASRLSR